MKRINRKRLIEDLEGLRQGFRDALDFTEKQTPAFTISMNANHHNADRMIVELGGETVRTVK